MKIMKAKKTPWIVSDTKGNHKQVDAVDFCDTDSVWHLLRGSLDDRGNVDYIHEANNAWLGECDDYGARVNEVDYES